MTDLVVTLRLKADGSGYTGVVRNARGEVTQLGQASGVAQGDMRRLSTEMDRVAQRASSLERAATLARRAIGGITAAVVLRELRETVDGYANLDAKLRLATQGEAAYATAKRATFEIAQRTNQSLDATVTLYGRLSSALRSQNVSQAETLRLTETINQALIVSGATQAESASAVLQLSQAFGAGRLAGEEFNAVNEAGGRLMQALADSLGVARGDLKKMAEEGKLTSQVLREAFSGAQAQQIAEEFSKVPLTIERAWQRLGNAVTRYVGEADRTSGASQAVAEAIAGVADNLGTLVELLERAGAVGLAIFAGRNLQALKTFSGEALAARAVYAELTAAGLAAAQASAVDAAAKTREAQATLGAIEAARADAIAKLAQANASVQSAKATIATTQAMATLSGTLRAQQLATEQLTASETRRAAIMTELAVLGRQQAAVQAQLAASSQALVVAQTRVAEAQVASAAASATGAGIMARAAAGIALVGRGLLAFVGGPIGATIIGLYALWSAFEAGREEREAIAQQLKTASDALEDFNRKADQVSLEQLKQADVGQALELRARQVVELRLELERLQAQQLRMQARFGNLEIGVDAKAAELRAAEQELQRMRASAQQALGTLADMAREMFGLGKSAKTAARDLAEFNESLDKQLDKLRLERIETQQGLGARLLAEAVDAAGVQSAEQLADAVRKKIEAIVAEQRALDSWKTSRDAATRELEEARTAYQALIEKMNPVLALEREHQRTIQQVTLLRKAGDLSEREFGEAVQQAGARLRDQKRELVENSEAFKALQASIEETERAEADYLESRARGAEQLEETRASLLEEIRLLELSGEAREDLAIKIEAARLAEADFARQTGITAEEIEKLLRKRRELVQRDQVANEWRDMWSGAAESVGASIMTALTGNLDEAGDQFMGAMERLAQELQQFWLKNKIIVPLQQSWGQGQAMTPEQRQQVGEGLFMMGSTALGSAAGGGGSGAQTGATIGAAIGSIFGPIGTIVGGLLGGLVGGLFDDDGPPQYRVGQNNRPEASTSGVFGRVYAGTARGAGEPSDLANRVVQFDAAIAQLLTAQEIERVRTAVAGINGTFGSVAEVLSVRLNTIVRTLEPQWAAFLSSIEDVQARTEAFGALRGLRTWLEDFELLEAAFDADPVVTLRAELERLSRSEQEAIETLDRALALRDPVGIAKALDDVQAALVQRYERERQLVEQLVAAINQAEDAMRNFRVEMAGRQRSVGGTPAVSGAIRADVGALRTSVETAANTEQALANLDRFVSAVDQWLSESRAEVEQWAAQARARVNAELAALDTERNTLLADAQARADAAAAAAQAADEQARSALEERRRQLEAELAIAQQFAGVLEQANRFLQEMQLTRLNPLPTSARADLLEQQIEALRGRYQAASGAERATLAQELLGLLQQRMEFAGELNQRPSAEYLADYNRTIAEVSTLRDEAQTQADRELTLQEELNALQGDTTQAVNRVVDVLNFLSYDERARLDVIEERRTTLQGELEEIERESQRRLGEIEAIARADYEWATQQGDVLLQRRHEELMLQLDAVTGGMDPDSFLAMRAAESAQYLRDIRDRIDAFMTAIAGGTGAGGGGGPGRGGPGGPDDGDVTNPPAINVGVTVQSANPAGTTPEEFQRLFEAAVVRSAPLIKRALANA